MPTPQPLRSSLSKPDIVKINPPEFSPESDSCIHNILQYTNISFYYILKLTFIIADWSCPAIMARLLSRLTESYNMISNFKHLGRRTTFIISLSLSLSLSLITNQNRTKIVGKLQMILNAYVQCPFCSWADNDHNDTPASHIKIFSMRKYNLDQTEN